MRKKRIRDMELIKFKDALEKIDDNTVIKLASRGGTAFFFIGTKKELDAADTDVKSKVKKLYFENVMFFDNEYQETKKKVDEDYKKAFEEIESIIGDAKKGLPVNTKTGSLDTVVNFRKNVLKRIRDMSFYEYYRRALPERFEDRRVLAAYEANPVVDKNAIIIWVEGNEDGGYWLKSEVKKGRAFNVRGFSKLRDGFKEVKDKEVNKDPR